MNKVRITHIDDVRQGFLFYGLSALLLAVMFATYISDSEVLRLMDFEGWVFFVSSCVSHAAVVALLPFTIALLPYVLGLRRTGGVIHVVLMSLIVILNYVNEQVYALYRFHINGFIVNMMTGPAAGDVFTFDIKLYVKVVGIFLLLIGIVVAVWCLAKHIFRKKRKAYAWVFFWVFWGCTLFAHLWNIYADFYHHQSVAKSGQLLPYYFPTTARGMMVKTFGLEPPLGNDDLVVDEVVDDCRYPFNELERETPDTLRNIIVIMIDSWNKRTLTAECMPNTYAFAMENQWFCNHLSCSNGTKTAVFGFFFGIPGYYWDTFESAGVKPVLIKELQRNGYDIQAFASAGLENPPIADIVFGDVKGIHSKSHKKKPFVNDRLVTEECITKIKGRGEKPFFYYLFLDLPHSFAGITKEENSVFQPAWNYADYSKLDNDADPMPFFNLYRNCCHYDDKLIGRVLRTLADERLMDNTIVIITGDHSQEFNENKKNYWGHNGNFSKWQIGVQMILHEPGNEPIVYRHRTTHYDIVPTLMKRYFGVTNHEEDYCMGYLMTDTTERLWHVVGSRQNFAFIIQGDTILERKDNGSLEVNDANMNEVFDYKIDAKRFIEATKRLNHFYIK